MSVYLPVYQLSILLLSPPELTLHPDAARTLLRNCNEPQPCSEPLPGCLLLCGDPMGGYTYGGPHPFIPSAWCCCSGGTEHIPLPREMGSSASLEVCPALSEEQAIWIMIISPLAPAISCFKHLFFLNIQWPVLKQSDLAS